MKVHKVELLVVDFDDLGADSVAQTIECVRWPNDCMSPNVMHVETIDIEWDDSHPLNNTTTHKAAFADLFAQSGIAAASVKEK